MYFSYVIGHAVKKDNIKENAKNGQEKKLIHTVLQEFRASISINKSIICHFLFNNSSRNN